MSNVRELQKKRQLQLLSDRRGTVHVDNLSGAISTPASSVTSSTSGTSDDGASGSAGVGTAPATSPVGLTIEDVKRKTLEVLQELEDDGARREALVALEKSTSATAAAASKKTRGE